MPIYEFKCSECETFFEILVMKSDEEHEIKCTQCGSSAVERVCERHQLRHGTLWVRRSDQGGSKQERTCSSGSCTTYTVPGESRS